MGEPTALGRLLRTTRQRLGLKLRDVEEATGVSNAHVSQIESGRIREPSPQILLKLSEAYGVPYELLLEKAGYPLPTPARGAARRRELLAEYGEVSDDEEQALGEYLEFLRSRTREPGR
jgi:transcriptional regulator with XRE-family HTH domain